jgi:hypothetical protein
MKQYRFSSKQQLAKYEYLLFLFKKNISKKILNFCFIIFVASMAFLNHSCAPAYIPNMVNSPLFSNKGECNASISAGFSGFDPQLSYALTNNVGLILNGSFMNSSSNDGSNDFMKWSIFDAGLGYYHSVEENGRVEVYGGYGFGKVNGQYDLFETTYKTNSIFNKIFVQPDIGIAHKIYDGSFAIRFSFINMHLSDPSYSGNNIFIEPVLTHKIGYKNLRIILQIGFSLPIMTTKTLQYGGWQPFIYSIGLQLNLGRKY